MGTVSRFSPFSGCFCYKNFFNTGRIADFFVTTFPESEYPEESFLRQKKIQKKLEGSVVFLKKKSKKN